MSRRTLRICCLVAERVRPFQIISGHNDGSVYRFCFDSGEYGPSGNSKICTHSVPPNALAWGEAICVAGNDCKICFYDKDGTGIQEFDHSGAYFPPAPLATGMHARSLHHGRGCDLLSAPSPRRHAYGPKQTNGAG